MAIMGEKKAVFRPQKSPLPCREGRLEMADELRKTLTSALSDDILALIRANDLSERAQSIYYYLYDKSLHEDDRAYLIDLLTDREHSYGKTNAELCDDAFIEDLVIYRSQGLSLQDASALLGVTRARLESLLAGNGLSKSIHKKLLKAVYSADARCKSFHLQVIQRAASEGDWKASIEILERLYPEDYAKTVRQNITSSNNTVLQSTVNATLSTEECENRALKAKAQLAEYRRNRRFVE